MVLAHLGHAQDEAHIARTLGAKPYGTPSFAIEKLNDSAIQVIYQQWSTSELSQMLVAGYPVIVFVRTIFLDYYQEDFDHALVVIECVPGQHVQVHDPAQPTGPTAASWDGFLAAWSEFDYYGAVIRPR
jgi:hypothetical protein